jgi:hypothetical protein
MTDPALFGDTFGGDSFAAWSALLAGFYGLPLDATQAETFAGITGGLGAPQEAQDELWLVVVGPSRRQEPCSGLVRGL